MSYRLNMYLKQFDNEGNALSFANKMVGILMSHSSELLKENVYLIPQKDLTNPYPYWLYSFYNFRFIYFKGCNVLGLIGDFSLKEVTDMFDTSFYFQNSTDQDYDYDLWSDNIEVFKENKQRIVSLTDEELVNAMINDTSNYYSETDRTYILEDIDYYRKTYLYQTITNQMGILDFIYDKESDKYEVIILNGIKSQGQYFQLCREFHNVVKNLT